MILVSLSLSLLTEQQAAKPSTHLSIKQRMNCITKMATKVHSIKMLFFMYSIYTTTLTVGLLVGISQARNRWLVAYTLLRNPSLQELTASKIRNRNTQEVATMNAERGTSKGASNWIFGIEANEKQPELV